MVQAFSGLLAMTGHHLSLLVFLQAVTTAIVFQVLYGSGGSTPFPFPECPRSPTHRAVVFEAYKGRKKNQHPTYMTPVFTHTQLRTQS